MSRPSAPLIRRMTTTSPLTRTRGRGVPLSDWRSARRSEPVPVSAQWGWLVGRSVRSDRRERRVLWSASEREREGGRRRRQLVATLLFCFLNIYIFLLTLSLSLSLISIDLQRIGVGWKGKRKAEYHRVPAAQRGREVAVAAPIDARAASERGMTAC